MTVVETPMRREFGIPAIVQNRTSEIKHCQTSGRLAYPKRFLRSNVWHTETSGSFLVYKRLDVLDVS